MEKTLDARGLICPRPLILTKNALQELPAGALTVIVDNATAVANLKAYAESQGLGFASEQKDGDFYVRLQKNVAYEAATADERRVVVLISSEAFGAGDAEFGVTLMRNFLFALAEAETPPATVIFVNGGVRHSTAGSLALESLQKLAERGVELLSCGACLDFYGLKETLSVGAISNMYVIAEKLLAADHVIKP